MIQKKRNQKKHEWIFESDDWLYTDLSKRINQYSTRIDFVTNFSERNRTEKFGLVRERYTNIVNQKILLLLKEPCKIYR